MSSNEHLLIFIHGSKTLALQSELSAELNISSEEVMKCSEEDGTPDVFREGSGHPVSPDATVTFKMDVKVNCLIANNTSKYHQSFTVFGSVIQARLSR